MDENGDEKTRRAHFTIAPNVVFDLGLDPYEGWLYLLIRKIAGESGVCYAATRTLAAQAQMSVGKVSAAKQGLKDKGLVTITEVRETTQINGVTLAPQPGRPWHAITVVDVWAQNAAYTAGASQGAQSSPPELQSSPHELREGQSSSRELQSSPHELRGGQSSPHELQSSPGEPKKTPESKTSEQQQDAPAREAGADVPARHRPMAAPAAAAAVDPAALPLRALPDPARWPNLAEALGGLPLDDPAEAMLLRAHEQVFGLPLPPAVLPDVADFLAAFGPALSQDLVTQTFQACADAGERPGWFTLRKALMRAVGDARRSNGHAPPEPAHARRQRALLRAFGVDRGRARDEIVALGLPDAHIAGWGLEIARQQRDGERGITAANAAGALVTALREGRENPPPEPMLLLGRLTAAHWRALALLARAIHETSVARGALMPVPDWMPPELADVWPAWARVYTTGAARDGPARHYALRVEGVPAALLGDALAADVEAWIQAHAPAKRGDAPARSEAVPA